MKLTLKKRRTIHRWYGSERCCRDGCAATGEYQVIEDAGMYYLCTFHLDVMLAKDGYNRVNENS